MIECGDGQPAPPADLPRESIELQRAGGRIALRVRDRLPEGRWLHIEADVFPNLMRLVFNCGKFTSPGKRDVTEIIELELVPGYPLDDSIWLNTLAADVLEMISSGATGIILPRPIDYVRLCDASGETLHEAGRYLRPDGSFGHTRG